MPARGSTRSSSRSSNILVTVSFPVTRERRGRPVADRIGCRVHKTLGTTPAVAAGIADHVWTLDELIGLLEAAEATPVKRGTYKKRAA